MAKKHKELLFHKFRGLPGAISSLFMEDLLKLDQRR